MGVAGARGGCGASTLAAVLAARLGRQTATVLVDLDHVGAGIDLLLGLEDVPGVRWPDLAGARGDVPGRDLLAALPRWGRCAVLAAGRAAAPPDDDVVADVLRALSEETGTVVLDLGRARGSDVAPDALVLVVPRDVRGVASASAVRAEWAARGVGVAVVARGPAPGGMGVSELAQAVGAPVTASLPTVRGLAADVERAGLVVRRPLARVADRLARDLVGVP
jgi:secretion/DNA translocation related CpaE-like protein